MEDKVDYLHATRALGKISFLYSLKYFGFFMIVLAQAIFLTGTIQMYYLYVMSNPYIITSIVAIFVFFFGMEVYYQRLWRKESPYLETQTIISQGEYYMRVEGGEQLVILDDLVLDVSEYQWTHPGGWFVIGFNIGRDISKFFYGGYSLENAHGLAPYNHSNIARLTVNTLVVGRLQERAKTFSCKITEVNEVIKDVYTFTL